MYLQTPLIYEKTVLRCNNLIRTDSVNIIVPFSACVRSGEDDEKERRDIGALSKPDEAAYVANFGASASVILLWKYQLYFRLTTK